MPEKKPKAKRASISPPRLVHEIYKAAGVLDVQVDESIETLTNAIKDKYFEELALK